MITLVPRTHHQKTLDPMLFINLLVQDEMPITLAKQNATFKQGSRNTSKHLNDNANCRRVCNKNSFEVIDSASSSFRLKVKEAIHITWSKPSLNKQVNHVSMTITV